jgi:hypothetical protein
MEVAASQEQIKLNETASSLPITIAMMSAPSSVISFG